jgi:hypothetical protein
MLDNGNSPQARYRDLFGNQLRTRHLRGGPVEGEQRRLTGGQRQCRMQCQYSA